MDPEKIREKPKQTEQKGQNQRYHSNWLQNILQICSNQTGWYWCKNQHRSVEKNREPEIILYL